MRFSIVLLCLVSLSGCLALTGCCEAFNQDGQGNVPAQDFVTAVRTVNAASAPVNPLAIPIDIGLGLLSTVLFGVTVKKSRQLSTVGKKYEAHKRGVEATMREETPTNARLLYQAIGNERKKLGI